MDTLASAIAGGSPLRVRIRRPSEKHSVSRSASRALDVLECFGQLRQPLRARELTSRLGIPPSTTDQLLKTLVASGHLVFNARDKTYFPSPRLAPFARWMAHTAQEGSPKDLVLQLRQRMEMIVTLATPNGLFMQIMDLAQSPQDTTERGMMISLFGSALGTAYLATLEQEEVLALADRARIASAVLPELLEDIAATREQGYALIGADDGRSTVAMAIASRQSHVPLVLGATGPDAKVREDPAAIFALMQDSVRYWLPCQDSQA